MFREKHSQTFRGAQAPLIADAQQRSWKIAAGQPREGIRRPFLWWCVALSMASWTRFWDFSRRRRSPPGRGDRGMTHSQWLCVAWLFCSNANMQNMCPKCGRAKICLQVHVFAVTQCWCHNRDSLLKKAYLINSSCKLPLEECLSWLFGKGSVSVATPQGAWIASNVSRP